MEEIKELMKFIDELQAESVKDWTLDEIRGYYSACFLIKEKAKEILSRS